MALNITPVSNHRGREKGVLVYPVYSRRSEGLSVGINLYPDKKSCPFDCPYCEVFPFVTDTGFLLRQMEDDLRSVIAAAHEQDVTIKDICFSGNGEPTLSPAFSEALRSVEKIRQDTASSAQLVVITNGAGLLQPDVFSLLTEAAANPTIDIWLKVDAGTQCWYDKINRSTLSFDKLTEKKKEFASCAPFTIQTMLCAVHGEAPPKAEERAWEELVCGLAGIAANSACGSIRKVQLYGKARPAPEDPLASSLPDDYLEERAASLLHKFAEKDITTPVEIYT